MYLNNAVCTFFDFLLYDLFNDPFTKVNDFKSR